MPILFDADPETGLRTYYDYDPINDQVRLTYQQNVTGFLDRMKAHRLNEDRSAKGIKEDWWHYCSIPPVVEIELKNRGYDIHNPDHMKDIIKIVNSEFPHLKATDKWHHR